MKRCVIIGGAPVSDYARAASYVKPDDFIIYCDCGLKHEEKLGVSPSLIIGDFDSHPRPDTDTEIITLPREKDDTDTFYAVKEALRRGYDSFILLGVIGARFDHSLGNISVLLYLDSKGIPAIAADDYSEFSVVSSKAEAEDSYPYFSLLSVDGSAVVSIENAKFPLDRAVIDASYQYGISNEPLAGGAVITIHDGRLLLMKVIKG